MFFLALGWFVSLDFISFWNWVCTLGVASIRLSKPIESRKLFWSICGATSFKEISRNEDRQVSFWGLFKFGIDQDDLLSGRIGFLWLNSMGVVVVLVTYWPLRSWCIICEGGKVVNGWQFRNFVRVWCMFGLVPRFITSTSAHRLKNILLRSGCRSEPHQIQAWGF